MNDWAAVDDDDMDEQVAEVKREQARVIEEDVPEKVGECFDQLFGGGWMVCPRIVERFAKTVEAIQAQLGGLVELTNADFEIARVQGFPEDFKPVRH